MTCTTKRVLGCALEQHSFTLQDRECLLQACDLCGAPLHSLLIRFWLCDAAFLDACIVLVHCIQFLLDAGPVGCGFGSLLVEALGFLRLVFHILFFGCLHDLILLCCLFVLGNCGFLCCNHFGEALRKVRLAHLKEADDAAASAICGTVRLICLCIVF